ncbi:hypothetical protein ACFVRB_21715 [Streptomyces nojiriensis]|uniref:hypothetical protein n=1 Tax=Streptomyces nojiriensis TaxID=66374 RepID=UPI0036DF1A70
MRPEYLIRSPRTTAGVPDASAALSDLTVSVPEYQGMWAAVWAAHAVGDLPTAVALACKLEIVLAGWFGEDIATITVLTARAWLALCRRTDWHGTTELLITTSLRCQAARYRPEADTIRTARNAHACWHLLMGEDPQAAADLAGRLADTRHPRRGRPPPRRPRPDRSGTRRRLTGRTSEAGAPCRSSEAVSGRGRVASTGLALTGHDHDQARGGGRPGRSPGRRARRTVRAALPEEAGTPAPEWLPERVLLKGCRASWMIWGWCRVMSVLKR